MFPKWVVVPQNHWYFVYYLSIYLYIYYTYYILYILYIIHIIYIYIYYIYTYYIYIYILYTYYIYILYYKYIYIYIYVLYYHHISIAWTSILGSWGSPGTPSCTVRKAKAHRQDTKKATRCMDRDLKRKPCENVYLYMEYIYIYILYIWLMGYISSWID